MAERNSYDPPHPLNTVQQGVPSTTTRTSSSFSSFFIPHLHPPHLLISIPYVHSLSAPHLVCLISPRPFQGTVGVVIASNSPRFAVGDWAVSYHGWQSIVRCHHNELTTKLDPTVANPSSALGVLGMPGRYSAVAHPSVFLLSSISLLFCSRFVSSLPHSLLRTAWFGLMEAGQPRPGETLVVSGAAGAVGSLVCQFGKRAGCRVVGIAGGSEKCHYLTEVLKCDAAVDYKKYVTAEALQAELSKVRSSFSSSSFPLFVLFLLSTHFLASRRWAVDMTSTLTMWVEK